MKTVTAVSRKKLLWSCGSRKEYIEIKYVNGYLKVRVAGNNKNPYYLISYGENSWTEIINDPKKCIDAECSFRGFEEYTKAELEKFQKIILFAYVFLNDDLEEAISKTESKYTLNEKKEFILDLRKDLHAITHYIDSYEKILDEFRNI